MKVGLDQSHSKDISVAIQVSSEKHEQIYDQLLMARLQTQTNNFFPDCETQLAQRISISKTKVRNAHRVATSVPNTAIGFAFTRTTLARLTFEIQMKSKALIYFQ